MQPGSDFSLLVPTRGRPALLRRLVDSLAATAAHPERIEVVLVIDEDDPASLSFEHGGLTLRRVVVPPGRTMGELNTAAYEASSGQYVMLLNDDVVARTPGWDELVLPWLRGCADGIVLVHVNDTLMRDSLCTFPLVTRTFCALAGGICPPAYRRYRIDDHVEDVFNLLAVLGERRSVYLPDVVFEHDNFVELPGGHREYHGDPAVLALDAPLFLELFPQRKELALRLLDHIEDHRLRDLAQARRRLLDALDDPFSLRTPSRLRVIGTLPGSERPNGWARLRACYQQRGLAGLARAAARRLTGFVSWLRREEAAFAGRSS